MVNYVKLAATAQRLVEKNGQPLALYKTNRAAADPAKPWRGTGALAPEGVAVIVLGVVVPEAGSGFGQRRTIDGTLADRFENIAIVAANSVPTNLALETCSTLVFAGKSFKIDAVEKLQPGPVTMLYVLRLSA